MDPSFGATADAIDDLPTADAIGDLLAGTRTTELDRDGTLSFEIVMPFPTTNVTQFLTLVWVLGSGYPQAAFLIPWT